MTELNERKIAMMPINEPERPLETREGQKEGMEQKNRIETDGEALLSVKEKITFLRKRIAERPTRHKMAKALLLELESTC